MFVPIMTIKLTYTVIKCCCFLLLLLFVCLFVCFFVFLMKGLNTWFTQPRKISGNSKGVITRPDTRVNTILKHNKKIKNNFYSHYKLYL